MRKYYCECDTESIVLKALGFEAMSDNHKSGSGGVCRKLAEVNQSTGLIDFDPDITHHSYFDQLLKKAAKQNGLATGIDFEKGNRLIAYYPRFEEWLIDVCELKAGIRMQSWNLVNDPLKLHGIFERDRKNSRRDLHKLITYAKARVPEIIYLKKLLEDS